MGAPENGAFPSHRQRPTRVPDGPPPCRLAGGRDGSVSPRPAQVGEGQGGRHPEELFAEAPVPGPHPPGCRTVCELGTAEGRLVVPLRCACQNPAGRCRLVLGPDMRKLRLGEGYRYGGFGLHRSQRFPQVTGLRTRDAKWRLDTTPWFPYLLWEQTARAGGDFLEQR